MGAWLEPVCDRDLLVWAAWGPLLLFILYWGLALACSRSHMAAHCTNPLLIAGTASGTGRTLLHKALSPSVSGETVFLPLQVLSPEDLQSGESLLLPLRGLLLAHTTNAWDTPCPPRPSPLHLWEGEQGSARSVGFLQRSQQHPKTAHLSRVAGSWTSQSTTCIPASFLPHLPAAQPLV